jgi:hypothetical protein
MNERKNSADRININMRTFPKRDPQATMPTTALPAATVQESTTIKDRGEDIILLIVMVPKLCFM